MCLPNQPEMTLTPSGSCIRPRLPVAALSRQELLRHLEATAIQREDLKRPSTFMTCGNLA
jgi:hypothetical protein